jgi:hypothetical protein
MAKMLIFDVLKTSQSFASSPGVLIRMMDNCVLRSIEPLSFPCERELPGQSIRFMEARSRKISLEFCEFLGKAVAHERNVLEKWLLQNR